MLPTQISAEPDQQASQSSTSSPKFVFGLGSLATRNEQLFLSEYLSDVVFKVGSSSSQLLHAHKLILTVASEVFFKQFSGCFAESRQDNRENPVVIEDIEPATFTEVLRYIYYEQVYLTPDNIVDIYYAADKYCLTDLKGVCENYPNESNVMAVLNDNRRYGFANVDQSCLKVIQDNPIKCFQSDDFLTLSQPALELIAACRTMNCLQTQLCEAIQKWCKANDSKVHIQTQWEALQCHKIYFTNTSGYDGYILSQFKIRSEQKLFLHGLGVFVGKEWHDNSKPTSAKITVTLSKNDEKLSISKDVSVGKHHYVEKICFEKTLLDECCIDVRIEDTSKTCTQFFRLRADSDRSNHAYINGMTIKAGEYDGGNCVAYLLYTGNDL